MNFNNPDDVYSSSPLSGESAVGSSPFQGGVDEAGSEDDGDSIAMSLVTDAGEPTVTGRLSGSSESSTDSTGSSVRLDAALRQAAEAAGTKGIELDESREVSMDLEDETPMNAFQPWINERQGQARAGGSPVREGAKLTPVLDKDKENLNPFSPAFKAASARPSAPAQKNEEPTSEMSMDITQAVGGILPTEKQAQLEMTTSDGTTMDLTVAVGRIQPNQVDQQEERTTGPKRRRTLSSGSPLKFSRESQGSPASRRTSRGAITKRRRSSAVISNADDATMDFTTAVGGIQRSQTKAVGSRRASAARRRSSAESSALEDEAMDLTMAIGSIHDKNAKTPQDDDPSMNSNEELSMELTTVIGGIRVGQTAEQAARPETPTKEAPPEVNVTTLTPKDQTRFKEVEEPTPKKLTPLLEKQIRSPETKTSPPSSRKSPRKSLGRSALREVEQAMDPQPMDGEVAAPATPEIYNDVVPEDEKENEIPSPSPKKTTEVSPAVKSLVTPNKEPIMKGTKALSESMRLLSTPCKESSQSPLKRLANSTPKKQATPKAKSPFRKNLTPSKRARLAETASPRKKVQIEGSSASPATYDQTPGDNEQDAEGPHESGEQSPERIYLQDFLNMTSIRFMELTTTKRRHTAAPSAMKSLGLDAKPSESQQNLESRVAAGACLVPTLEMFQHSCRELKRYISSGHDIVDEIAADVAERQPPLFSEYASAPRGQKAIMDKQFINVKTNARLLSKGMWYEWRGQLLMSLKQGLQGIAEGLNEDASWLEHKEQIVENLFPELQAKRENLETDKQVLEEQAREFDGNDEEELGGARDALISVGNGIEEKRRRLEELQQEMHEKHEAIQMAQERKSEMTAEIKEAERVREECRGWSAAEVQDLQGMRWTSKCLHKDGSLFRTESVHALETEHGWSIASASSTNITMVYRNDVQLFFDMASFLLGNSLRATKQGNSPIRLTYIGDDHESRPRRLTTEKRFFLQVMRAHLQCLTQGQTRVRELLGFVATGWQRVCAVSDAVQGLEREFISDVSIVSDEKLEIRSMMLLSKLETKVMVRFEVGAVVKEGRVSASVLPTARVVYGESYNEPKMAEFLASNIGDGFKGWAAAVRELQERLIAKGRKAARA